MISSILQVAGLTGISVGVCMISLPFGIMTIGVSLLLIGIAMERSINAR